MRGISAGLRNAQQAVTGSPLVIVGLTKPGSPGYSYQTSINDSGRIFAITHTEGAYSGGAIIKLKNHDKALTNIDFQGYRCSIGWGFFGPDQVSTSAPMYVWSQRTVSEEGKLLIELVCVDEWERIARAIIRGDSWGVAPKWEDTAIVAILGQLFSDLGVGWHPDDPDNQANSYEPEFGVDLNTSARDTIRQLLGMTECVVRMRADGAHLMHLQDGDAIDYEYDSAHAFYSDVRDWAAPAYNYVIVQNREPTSSEEAASPTTTFYQGEYEDTASTAKFGVLRQIIIMPWVESDAMCATLAQCLVRRALSEASQGTVIVPMNVAQEIYDKVKVVDARAGCEVIGRVGQLVRVYGAGEYRVEIRLGGVSTAEIIDGLPPLPSDILGITPFPTFWPSTGIPMAGIGRWLLPIAVDIEFTSPAWNQVNWTSGYVRFADGGSQAIDAGGYTFSSYDQRRYLYFRMGYSTLFNTSDFATAACGNDRSIVALIRAGSDDSQRAMILTFRGKEPYLNSAAIAEGAVTSILLDKASQPFNCSVTFSGTAWNGVAWTGGSIAFADGDTKGINAGSKSGIPAVSTRYIYYSIDDPNLKVTSNYAVAIGAGKVLLCMVTVGTSTQGQSPVILPFTTKGLVVNAVAIAADVITAQHIQTDSIVARHLTVDSVEAAHINIGTLSVIGNADMGLLTAGEIRLGTGSLGSFTGWRLWMESGIGRCAGYQSGTIHWYSGTDGRFYAMGGDFMLDAYGCVFNTPHADSTYFWLKYAGVTIGGLGHAGMNVRLSSNSELQLRTDVGHSVVVSSDFLRPMTHKGVSLGHPSFQWNDFYVDDVRAREATISQMLYTIGLRSDSNYPRYGPNSGSLGTSGYYWRRIYGNEVRYKSIGPFQKHDDIVLIKSMKPDKKNPEVLFIPDEIRSLGEEGELEDFIDLSKFSGLITGTLQQLIDRVEKLEEES